MKKFFYSFMAVMMAMSMSMSFSSCSDDDDNEGSGSSSSSGVKVSVNRGYYLKDGTRYYEFIFADFSPKDGVPSGKHDAVMVSLHTDEVNYMIPTGEFEGCFEVEVMKNYDIENKKGTLYSSGSYETTTGTLAITKKGDKYTVSYKGVDLYDDDSEVPAVKNTSFTYTGKIEKYLDDDDDDY